MPTKVGLWALLVVGLGVVWLRGDTNAVATVLTVLTGAAAVVQFLVGQRTGGSADSTPEQVDAAADTLADEVALQWRAEARRRMLDEAHRLPVRCRPLHGAAVDEQDCAEFVAGYVDHPSRLVVVGEAGAGKTGLCVQIILEVLARPEHVRVPVLLPISTWNPQVNIESWVLTNLVETYPFLRDRARFGPTAPEALVGGDRLLLVLDGLDEMAPEQRAAALRAIDSDLGASRASVLTCRSAEFAAANAGGLVQDSRVVELMPLRGTEIAGHLRATTPQAGLERWTDVIDAVGTTKGQALGHALRTPLMLSLARAVYSDSAAEPAELLRLDGSTAVQNRLLDRFAQQAFTTSRPSSPLSRQATAPRRWSPERSERWLAFLATRYREVTWWHLWRAVPVWVFVVRGVVFGGGVSALLGWLLLGLFDQPVLGLLLGLGVGAVGGTGLAFVPAEPPRRFVPRRLRGEEVGRDLVFVVVGAVAGGVAVGVLYGGMYGVVVGLLFGAAYGVVRRFTEPTQPSEAATPDSLLRDDQRSVLIATGIGAALGGLAGAFFGGVVGVGDLGLVVPVTHPVLVGLLGGVVGLVLGAGGLGLATYATSACGRFAMARMWLALTRRTPWLLMPFLREAHRLGVLRLVGPVYQFRHELLRERLVRQQ